MFRRLLACLMLLIPGPALAQDSLFQDYDAYMRFVDSHVMARDFVPLVLRLGGRDEYTDEQLKAADAQLMNAMPHNFSNAAVLKRVELSAGFVQEARVYWNDRLGYTYFYALLHELPDNLVVLRFTLNTSVDAVLEKF